METILKPIHQNWFQENERHERARSLIQINDDGDNNNNNHNNSTSNNNGDNDNKRRQ